MSSSEQFRSSGEKQSDGKNNLRPRGVAYRRGEKHRDSASGFGMYVDVVPREANMAGRSVVLSEQPVTPRPRTLVLRPRVFRPQAAPAILVHCRRR